MKKGLLGIMLGVFALFGVAAVVPAMAQNSNLPGTVSDGAWWGATDAKGDDMLGERKQTGSSLIETIKTFINWMLGMLATVALVICLYGGFLMVTAAGDEAKHKKGVTVLKQAGIGLAVIGCAWMIVSVVFWLVWNMSA